MTLLYAHRGAAAELPENTLPSFERALEVGADALEMDVHATRDGVLVVSHDPDGARMCGVKAAIAATLSADVLGWDAGHGWLAPDRSRPHAKRGFHLPRLLDVLRAFPGVRLNVDLKSPAADLAVELLRREKAEDRVCLASFSTSTLQRVRALGYAGATSLAQREVAQLLAFPAAAQRGPLKPAGSAAQLPVYLAQGWVVARCKALGLRVDFWTINDVLTAERVMALGVDGVMTDDPRLIAPVVKRLSRR